MQPTLRLSPSSVFRGVSPWQSKYQRMETGEQGNVLHCKCGQETVMVLNYRPDSFSLHWSVT